MISLTTAQSLTPSLMTSGSNLRQSKTFKKRKGKAVKGISFQKHERDILNFHEDHSHKKSWQSVIQRVALSQQDYPDGIGVKNSMAVIQRVVRDPERRKGGYVYCSPEELMTAVDIMKSVYRDLKCNNKSV